MNNLPDWMKSKGFWRVLLAINVATTYFAYTDPQSLLDVVIWFTGPVGAVISFYYSFFSKRNT